ncbi:uncharacterized protein LOC105696862 [Orussus abietinus]|uniref:uncharacterized protein LOC105696862 n=1 Tax=Orussus abietinus TaxID=222816 RepID=UPI00062684DF|nr:uncharacterized protein LOC105696862 [Orussus abietinus]
MESMDEESAAVKPVHGGEDVSDLPKVMAELEMLTVSSKGPLEMVSPNKRMLRKRIPKPSPLEGCNRRCNLKPRKRSHQPMESENDVINYYLDKSIKRKPRALETIFEEKDGCNIQQNKLMSARKFSRVIKFVLEPTDSQIKKRRKRIKKVFNATVKVNRKHMSMEAFLNKLKIFERNLSP